MTARQDMAEAKRRVRETGCSLQEALDNIRGDKYKPDKKRANGRNGKYKYANGEKRGAPVEAEYIYEDQDGNNYLRVERTEAKQFPQSHWENDEWIYGAPKGPKIPYLLPQLLAAPAEKPVFICEGEKDADSVYCLRYSSEPDDTARLISTSASGGAGKWTKDLNHWFAGKQTVYILEDNDDPGRAHAQMVARNLTGVVGEIRIVSLPGLDEHGDVSNWIEAREAEGLKPDQARAELLRLCAAAPLYKEKEPKQRNGKTFSLVCAKDIIIKPKDWLWEGHMLRGAQELLTGLPGLGKSQVQISLVACVTAGLPWPNGEKGMSPANVIMLTAEDTLDQEVVPRLIAAGANLERVQILKCIRSADGKDRQFLLGEDLDTLERAINQVGDVGLITIDPITAYMGKIDSHKTTDVRAQLGPLKDLAERTNVAVSTITHPAKSTSQKAIDQFIGSQAFIAAGRIGHVCIEEVTGEDNEKTGRILFTNAKNNPHTKMPSLAFRITEATIGQDPDTHTNLAAPHVVWEKDAVNITADEAVQAASGTSGGGKKSAGQKAVQEFLEEILRKGEPVLVKDIQTAATANGFTKDQLRLAKEKLGHIAVEQIRGAWTWQWIM
jgi:hypothetical protein